MKTENQPTSIIYSIPIRGMTCASCVGRIEKSVQKVEGLKSVAVNLATELAKVELNSQGQLKQVFAAIEKAGYEVPVEEIDFRVTGMTCASCISHVEQFLALVPGILTSQVNLATEQARVKIVKGLVTERQISQAVKDSGYEAKFEKSTGSNTQSNEKERELKQELVRLWLAAALTIGITPV